MGMILNESTTHKLRNKKVTLHIIWLPPVISLSLLLVASCFSSPLLSNCFYSTFEWHFLSVSPNPARWQKRWKQPSLLVTVTLMGRPSTRMRWRWEKASGQWSDRVWSNGRTFSSWARWVNKCVTYVWYHQWYGFSYGVYLFGSCGARPIRSPWWGRAVRRPSAIWNWTT